MVPPSVSPLFECLPEAIAEVAMDGELAWVEASFELKTGMAVDPGTHLSELFQPSDALESLLKAVKARRRLTLRIHTVDGKPVRVQARPSTADRSWLVLDESGVDDHVAFAHALHEIARAVGETLDVDAVCAAAVVAMVRFAQVSHAEAYLLEEGTLRRVASSDDAGAHGLPILRASSLKHALSTGQPEMGFASHADSSPLSVFAAVPLNAHRCPVGLLVLHKEPQASFSARELELWTAAAGQLAVSVENARLLRESQKALQLREEFMSVASHELKTPLTPLKMNLHLMQRRLEKGEPVETSHLRKAHRQVERLSALVDDLLDTSCLDLGRLELCRRPFDLREMVRDVTYDFSMASGRGVRVSLPERRCAVDADEDRLEQVLVNLLENAHKYSLEGQLIEVTLESSSEEVALHVRDFGIGIPEGERERIFLRFYRAKNADPNHFGGLGLGLYISQTIAHMHGGRLTVISSEGQGSRFTLTIPRVQSVTSQGSEEQEPVPGLLG